MLNRRAASFRFHRVFANVLEVALGDEKLRTSLARAARARARKFTWERTAAGVVEVIRELV